MVILGFGYVSFGDPKISITMSLVRSAKMLRNIQIIKSGHMSQNYF
jgi:hypothetical protein